MRSHPSGSWLLRPPVTACSTAAGGAAGEGAGVSARVLQRIVGREPVIVETWYNMTQHAGRYAVDDENGRHLWRWTLALQACIYKSVNRYYGSMRDAVDGLSREELVLQPKGDCMSIGFLVWHCARVHDFLVQTMMKGTGQLWIDEGWADRLNRGPANPMDTGFGFSAEQVN